jgi:hypothetical protein
MGKETFFRRLKTAQGRRLTTWGIKTTESSASEHTCTKATAVKSMT